MIDAFWGAVTGQLEGAVIEHKMPGRIRLRIRSRQGDANYFRNLVSLFSKCPAVEEISTNPKTAGVLIRYSLSGEEIEKLIGSIEPSPPPVQRSQQHSPRTVSNEEFAAGTLFGLSALQLARGRVVGNAVEQIWHLYQSARRLGVPGLAPFFAAAALIQFGRGRMFPPASTLLMYSLMLKDAGPSRPLTEAENEAAGELGSIDTK